MRADHLKRLRVLEKENASLDAGDDTMRRVRSQASGALNTGKYSMNMSLEYDSLRRRLECWILDLGEPFYAILR